MRPHAERWETDDGSYEPLHPAEKTAVPPASHLRVKHAYGMKDQYIPAASPRSTS